MKKFDLEVLHITEYLDRLIKESKLKLNKKINMRVTYSFTIGRDALKAKVREIAGKLKQETPRRSIRRSGCATSPTVEGCICTEAGTRDCD